MPSGRLTLWFGVCIGSAHADSTQLENGPKHVQDLLLLDAMGSSTKCSQAAEMCVCDSVSI